jgi:hypothetical protein
MTADNPSLSKELVGSILSTSQEWYKTGSSKTMLRLTGNATLWHLIIIRRNVFLGGEAHAMMMPSSQMQIHLVSHCRVQFADAYCYGFTAWSSAHYPSQVVYL